MITTAIGMELISKMVEMPSLSNVVAILGLIALVAVSAVAFHMIGDGFCKLTILWSMIFLLGQVHVFMDFCYANEDLLLVSDQMYFCWLFPAAAYTILLCVRTRFWIAGIFIRMILLFVIFSYFSDLGSIVNQYVETMTYLAVIGITADIASIILFTFEEDYPFPFDECA